MTFDKITEEQLIGEGVVGLPDTPGLSSKDMQKQFDSICREVIIPMYNSMVDKLNALGDEYAVKKHDSSTTQYGAGNNAKYGHVRLSDTYSSMEGSAENSLGLSQKGANDMYVEINGKLMKAVSVPTYPTDYDANTIYFLQE